MKLIARQKIRIYYYLAGVFAMVFMAASISVPYFISLRDGHQTKIEQLAQSIISEKKRHLADTINRTILEIDFIRKDVVNEYSGICLEVISILQMSHFGGSINTAANARALFNGVALSLPLLRAENNVSYVVYDAQNSQVVLASKDISAVQFVEALGSSGNNNKLYPSIATGSSRDGYAVYVFVSKDNVENIVKSRVKDLIRAVRLENDGYIWINQIVNYDGGDDYAIRLVHPNLPQTEGLKLSTKTEDDHGNFPYKVELEGVKKSGDLYFDYYFKKMNADTISHKLTYAKLYKPYDWVLATGVYLDDVDLLVQNEQFVIDEAYVSQVRTLASIVFAMFTVAIAALILFERQINLLISSYIDTIEKSEKDIRQEKDNVEKAFVQLESVAYLDYLTGLWNRRAMYGRIAEELSRCLRSELHFVVIIGDVDHFKRINDVYGHGCGDIVLQRLSEVMKQVVRAEDSVSRWGGEEFLILGTSCKISEGIVLAEKLRRSIESTEILLNGNAVKVTMTFGVAEFKTDITVDETIKEADSLLYIGKHGTRNCVISPMS